MSSRCDNVTDCNDKSDEKEWDLVNIDESYDRNINPPPVGDKAKTEVLLSIDLLSILQIDEIKSVFYVKYILQAQWFDTRLNFYNLKKKAETNII